MTENHNPYAGAPAPTPLAAARRIPATSARPPTQPATPLQDRTAPNGAQEAASTARPSTPPPRRTAQPALPPSPPSAARAAAPIAPPKPRPGAQPASVAMARTTARRPPLLSPPSSPLLDDEVFGVRAVEFWHPTTALVADAYAQDEMPRKRWSGGRRDGSLRTC